MGGSNPGPDLFDALKQIALPQGDFAVFGSGPLIVRGIIPLANDLDVVCRGPAWDHAYRRGTITHLDQQDVEVVSFLDGRITVGRSWAYGEPDINDLIDTAELIRDLPFVRLQHVIAYKTIAGRPKDRDHLKVLSQWELLD